MSKALLASLVSTADFYHVKADWPHQDTRGHAEVIKNRLPNQVNNLAFWGCKVLESCQTPNSFIASQKLCSKVLRNSC